MVAIATAQDKGFAARRSSRSTYPSPCFPPVADIAAQKLNLWPQTLFFTGAEDLPGDHNARTKLGKVTRKLRSELINWAEDGRPGESMAKDIAAQKLNLWPQTRGTVVASTCPTDWCAQKRLILPQQTRCALPVDF